MADFTIAVLDGDGIGPEVCSAAVSVARAAASDAGADLDFRSASIGGAAIDATGTALPAETLELCRSADAILLGAVGGPRWDDPRAEVRPEQGLLGLRRELGCFANLRPVRPPPALFDASPIENARLQGVDILFVRELTGGLYFGDRALTTDAAHDTCSYTAAEIERVVRAACRLALPRRRHVTSVDKANVLDTSRLWREVAERVVRVEFPEIRLDHVLVDAMAMHLLSRPADFDVVVTENLFGDILTDEASMLAGSLGLLASASLGEGHRGIYEPVHGSAPDIAGRGIANPFGAILSAALMFRHSLDLPGAARRLEHAVDAVLDAGVRTADLANGGTDPCTTERATATVLDALRHA